MAQPLTLVRQRSQEDWLAYKPDGDLPQEPLPGSNWAEKLANLAEQRTQELRQATNSGTPPLVLLTESDPIKFLAGFIAACTMSCSVFLGNSNWANAEWQQVWEVVQPDLIWGNCPNPSVQTRYTARPGWIMIPTGGSSGKIRFVIHTWKTLMASVQGFQQYFQIDQINSCCVLPLYHVSGLMQFLRSLTSQGQLAVLPFKTLASEMQSKVQSTIQFDRCFLSLVPTQLQRLLQGNSANLRQFHTVLLGGAPAWNELLEQARQQQIRIALTYGMTETASQIVTLKPEDFLQGNSSCGRVLPHAQVNIDRIGNLSIQAKSLALGYYPDRFIDRQFQVDDLGFFDAQNYLHIVGRSSQKIITGGENVFPAEVEAAIQATSLVADVGVVGLPDLQWGEAVTAIYIPQAAPQVADVAIALSAALAQKLSKFKQPKYWIAVETLPRNPQGKLNYQQLKQMALNRLKEL